MSKTLEVPIIPPVCWMCRGAGVRTYVTTAGGLHTVEDEPCNNCDGTGIVTWERIEGRQYGARVSGWRVGVNMLTQHMAETLGIPTSKLCDYEMGREPWPDGMQEKINKIILTFTR